MRSKSFKFGYDLPAGEAREPPPEEWLCFHSEVPRYVRYLGLSVKGPTVDKICPSDSPPVILKSYI